jgi:hypothetical protein
MATLTSSTSYSLEALQALQELLQSHRGLLWVDPTTNHLAVKHSTQPLKEEEAKSQQA